MLRIPSDQKKAGELPVHVVSRPGTEIGILGGFQVDQLSCRLIDKGFSGAEEGQRTVGGIHEGRKGGGRGERSGKQSRVETITNKGVPEFENDIHVEVHGDRRE